MSAKTTILHENGTDDELYPVTKASVTYRNDGTTTVEGTLTDYDTLETKFGDTSATLPTTAQTVIGAIAEHESNISDIKDDISTLNGNLSYKQLSPTFDASITNPTTILAYQIGHIVFIRFWGTIFDSAINKDCIFGMPKSVMQSTGSLALAGANSNTLVGNAYNTTLESTSIHVTLNSSAYAGAYNTYGYFCYLTSEDP